uniref:Uncharacterized protein n=1 Tax=viral metagenome TaxID=1070528 RepID=A0A6C0F0Y5_9ZZZZ
MSFTNPIEEIYKCSILKEGDNGGVPKCLYVFYGSVKGLDSPPTSKQLTHLYQEYNDNGSNTEVFENVFSKMELKNILRYKIKIRFVNFKIYSDDTIDVVKRKIMLAIKEDGDESDSAYTFDELYLFSKTPVLFDSNDVYQELSNAGNGNTGDEQQVVLKSSNLKDYLMGYSSSTSVGGETINVKDVFTTLKKLNAQKLFKDVPIGQSIPLSAYVNPFFIETVSVAPLEASVKKQNQPNAMSGSAKLLLEMKNIIHNTLFACFASDVLKIKKRKLAGSDDGDDDSIVLKTYYPHLYLKGIKNARELEDAAIQLRDETQKRITSPEFELNMKQINLFYDIFEESKKPKLKMEDSGITSIDIELLPDQKFNFPLELLFKLFHATKQCQLIKFNPPHQDSVFRMYTQDSTKDGKKIPYLFIQYQSETNKVFDIQQISKKMTIFANSMNANKKKKFKSSTTRVSLYIIYDKPKMQHGVKRQEQIPFICEFDEAGHIYIHSNFKHTYTEDAIDEMVRSAVSPHLKVIVDFLNQNGYRMRDFYSIYDDNVVIQNIEYLSISKLNNTEPIVWSNYYGCISSVMKVIENNWISEEKGVSMQYIRVPNFDESVLRVAYIEMLYNSGFRTKKDVIALMTKNLLVSKQVAEQSYSEFKTSFDGKYAKLIQQKKMPKKIYARKMPGFKTHMIKSLGDSKNTITIKITGINNIYILNPIRIYIDSLLHIFGNDEKYIPVRLVKQLCDITRIGTPVAAPLAAAVVPLVAVAPLVAAPLVAVADKEVIEEEEEEENKEEEEEEEDELSEADEEEDEEEEEEEDEEEDEEEEVSPPLPPLEKKKEKTPTPTLEEEEQEDEDELSEADEEEEEEQEEDEDVGDFDLLGGDGEVDGDGDTEKAETMGGAFESNPVYKRLKKMEPFLFGNTPGYATNCGWSARRQPIILTKDELEKIDADDEKNGEPSYYGMPLEYASGESEDEADENKHYYICPRYWNVIEKRSVSQKEIDDNNLQKNIVTKEESYDPANKTKFILDLTTPREHFKTGSYNPYLPGFLKTVKTKSGQCLPCCFTGMKGIGNSDGKDFRNYQLFKKEQEVIKKCKQKGETSEGTKESEAAQAAQQVKEKENPKKKKSKSNLYVSKADAGFPLQQNNLAFLPHSLQLFLFENENYSKECKSSKGDILVDDKLCVLRMGTVEEEKDAANVNKNQYFISCIANVYNSLIDQALSSKEFKHEILIPRLTFDNFITYQNGTLVETFKKFEYVDREKLLTYKETELFKKIFTDSDTVDDDEDNKVVFFKSLIMSYENFIDYLKNDSVIIDYTYLWDYITDSVLWSEFKKKEEEGKRVPPIHLNGVNLIILELTDNKDEVNIVCPTNHYSNSTFDSNKVNIIIVKYDVYYEPLYTYANTSKRNIISTVIFSSINSLKDKDVETKEIKMALGKIKSFFETECKPQQVVKSITQNKSFDEIVQILKQSIKQFHKNESVQQIIDYSGKVVGLHITLQLTFGDKMREVNGNILCNPSAINHNYKFVFINNVPTLWKKYEHTKDFSSFISKKSKGQIPCALKCKVVDNGHVIGFMTETNQFTPLRKPVQLNSVKEDGLKVVELGNSVHADMSILPQLKRIGFVFKQDAERTDDVEKIRLETNFYNAFRNIVRIQLNSFEFMELRNAIESLIYKTAKTAKTSAKGKMTRDIKKQHAIYVKKLNEMKALLVRLAKNHVQFSEINPAVLKDIYEQNTALSCITGKSSGSSTCKKLAYCFSVEKKDSDVSDVSDECGLYIPKRNLVDNADNEYKYYIRLADELLRYRRIRAFMLHPNKYLTFDDIHYNLKDDEMLLFEPDVKEYLEENNRAVAMNDYIKYKSYYTTEGEEFIDDSGSGDDEDDEDDDEDDDEEGVDVD